MLEASEGAAWRGTGPWWTSALTSKVKLMSRVVGLSVIEAADWSDPTCDPC